MIHDWNKINTARELAYQLISDESLRATVNEVMGGFQCVLKRNFPPSNTPKGQHDEDKIIGNLLPQESGTYVDVGAADPRDCSNTWRFYRRGWHGVLVEPLPQFWAALLRLRPRDRLIPVAASDRNGFAMMLIQGNISSLRPDWPAESQAQLWVEVEKLSELLTEQEQKCDLLCVDAEGHESFVLRGINWEIMRPKVACIEYNMYQSKQDLTSEWEPILLERGYKLHAQTELNKIYALA